MAIIYRNVPKSPPKGMGISPDDELIPVPPSFSKTDTNDEHTNIVSSNFDEGVDGDSSRDAPRVSQTMGSMDRSEEPSSEEKASSDETESEHSGETEHSFRCPLAERKVGDEVQRVTSEDCARMLERLASVEETLSGIACTIASLEKKAELSIELSGETKSAAIDSGEETKLLAKLFSRKIMQTDYEMKTLEAQSKEVQRAREDIYAKLTKPVLLQMIEAIKSLDATIAYARAQENPDAAVSLSDFELIRDLLLERLECDGVEIVNPEVGEYFQSGRERISSTVSTSNHELHRTIADVRSIGYGMRDATLEPAVVTVYTFDSQLTESKASPEETGNIATTTDCVENSEENQR